MSPSFLGIAVTSEEETESDETNGENIQNTHA